MTHLEPRRPALRHQPPTSFTAPREALAWPCGDLGCSGDDVVPGEVVLRALPTSPGETHLAEDLPASLRAAGVTCMRRLDLPQPRGVLPGSAVYRAALAPGVAVADALRSLQGQPGVVWAEPNFRVHALDGADLHLPNDLDARQWGLMNAQQPGADIHAAAAWAIQTGRKVAQGGPLLAVLDSGLDTQHPDLQANLYTHAGEIPGDGIDNDGNGFVDDVHGYDFVQRSGSMVDGTGHGTHVAATLAGVGDNGQGGVGVAWNADVMPLRFLDDLGFGDTATAAEALAYAERMGARITSNSWGSSHRSQALFEALQASHALHVCAAGNDGADLDDVPSYPAAYELDNIIAVAASDATDGLAAFSNRGASAVDLAAPGDHIWSALPGGAYGYKSGTSMAAPHVSGAAALVWSEYPGLTAAQVKERLLASTDALPVLEGVTVSGGRLNVARALAKDGVPPAPVTDLRATEVRGGQVTMGWTATGDDGSTGTAGRYELRWSTEPLPAGWEKAVPVMALPHPAPSGTSQQAHFAVLPAAQEQRIYVGLRVLDKVGGAAPLAVSTVDIPAASVALRDDFEHGSGQWQASEGWQIVGERGQHVLSDSPQGDYPANAEMTLTSRPVDLRGLKHPHLGFEGRWTVENGFDALHLEVSTDGGGSYLPLQRLVGKVPWGTHRVDLTPYAGQVVQLRFHLVSDADIEMDGLTLDNVLVADDAPEEAPPRRLA